MPKRNMHVEDDAFVDAVETLLLDFMANGPVDHYGVVNRTCRHAARAAQAVFLAADDSYSEGRHDAKADA